MKTGVFADTPAAITYQVESSGKATNSRSTGKGMTRVYTREEYITQVKSHHPQWVMVLALSLIVVVLPYRQYCKAVDTLARR